MIDKARMRENGTLGAYLMGHSPVDRALLKRLNLTTDEFVTIANAGSDDAAVLAALRARGFDEASVRSWSDRFEQSYKGLIPIWDIDDGYVPAGPAARPFLMLFHKLEGPLMDMLRMFSPAP
jgi:hypothetical protein